MNYYSLSFRYYGRKANIEPSSTATADLLEACDKVKACFDALKLDYRHQYAWPDGSLYEYVRSHLSADDLKKLINDALGADARVMVEYVTLVDPDETKAWAPRSVREIFDANKPEVGFA